MDSKASILILICIGSVCFTGYSLQAQLVYDQLKTQVITDGFNLTGTEIRNYTNTELIIRGQINLYDNSMLILNNTKIIVEMSYHKEFTLDVHNNASLIIDSCSYESLNYYWHNFNYYDECNIFLRNFTNEMYMMSPWTGISGNVTCYIEDAATTFTIFDSFIGNLTAVDSKKVYCELLLKPGEIYDETLPQGYTDFWQSSLFEGVVAVHNSTILQLDIDLFPGNNVTIRDTPSISFGWIFGNGWGHYYSQPYIPVTIEGIRSGYYTDKTIFGDNSSLRLINTSISHGFWPITNSNFNLTVIDCELADPWAYDTSVYTAVNCDIFYFSGNDNSHSYIINSTIENSVVALSSSYIELDNTEFTGTVSIAENAEIVINGTSINETYWNEHRQLPTTPPSTTPPTTPTSSVKIEIIEIFLIILPIIIYKKKRRNKLSLI